MFCIRRTGPSLIRLGPVSPDGKYVARMIKTMGQIQCLMCKSIDNSWLTILMCAVRGGRRGWHGWDARLGLGGRRGRLGRRGRHMMQKANCQWWKNKTNILPIPLNDFHACRKAHCQRWKTQISLSGHFHLTIFRVPKTPLPVMKTIKIVKWNSILLENNL